MVQRDKHTAFVAVLGRSVKQHGGLRELGRRLYLLPACQRVEAWREILFYQLDLTEGLRTEVIDRGVPGWVKVKRLWRT